MMVCFIVSLLNFVFIYAFHVSVFIHIVRLVCNGGASKIDMNDTLNYSNIVTDIVQQKKCLIL